MERNLVADACDLRRWKAEMSVPWLMDTGG